MKHSGWYVTNTLHFESFAGCNKIVIGAYVVTTSNMVGLVFVVLGMLQLYGTYKLNTLLRRICTFIDSTFFMLIVILNIRHASSVPALLILSVYILFNMLCFLNLSRKAVVNGGTK